ncbi:MAG: class I SAM-dependent methyltransferase [Candidatus Eisenbacteria sp.]|nr:class I SAM-dependent methyltransferase [Candidatus Eisenbacteria bacterium]
MKHRACPWRNAYLFDNVLRGLLHNPRKMLQPYVTPGMTVLDVGCGMGFFSIGMARLVGSDGLVIAVDLQQEMLDVVEKRAARAGVADRIRTHRCTDDNLGVTTKVDFALAFWMVHEVPDRAGLFRQLGSLLRTDGHLVIAEPKIHVSADDFRETLELAKAQGWTWSEDPRMRASRSAVLRVAAPAAAECRRIYGSGH